MMLITYTKTPGSGCRQRTGYARFSSYLLDRRNMVRLTSRSGARYQSSCVLRRYPGRLHSLEKRRDLSVYA